MADLHVEASGTQTLSLSDDLDQRAFRPAAVQLTVEDLYPRAEVEPSVPHRYDGIPAHQRPLPVEVGVAFYTEFVAVTFGSARNGAGFSSRRVVGVQAWFVVINEDAGGDKRRVDEAQALPHAALGHGALHLRREFAEAEAVGILFEPSSRRSTRRWEKSQPFC